MNKIFTFLLFCFLAMPTVTFGHYQIQAVSSFNVPAAILSDFSSRFPAATETEWDEATTETLICNFSENDLFKQVNYQKTGEWLRTITHFTDQLIPEQIATYLNANHSSNYVLDAYELNKKTEATRFFIELENGEEYLILTFNEAFELENTEQGNLEDR
ncbi:MAG: PepSY-like domain-containing protein [Flavobacteriales bacterium]